MEQFWLFVGPLLAVPAVLLPIHWWARRHRARMDAARLARAAAPHHGT